LLLALTIPIALKWRPQDILSCSKGTHDMIAKRARYFLAVILIGICSVLAFAQDANRFFDRDGLVLIARNPQPAPGETGVVEDPVPVWHVDRGAPAVLVGSFRVIDIADEVPGFPTPNPPLTVVDLVSNTFARLTPQNPDGTTSSLGTSNNRSLGFRIETEQLQEKPNANIHATIFTDTNSDRYRSVITGDYVRNGMVDANVRISTTFPNPPIGQTTIDVSSEITFQRDVMLANVTGFHPENDRLRLATFSSSFIGSITEIPDDFVLPDGTRILPPGATSFDANVIRFEDASGKIQTFALNDQTPKDKFLFRNNSDFGEAIELGNWVELLKTEPDTINPTSPSLRIDISNKHGQRLALQGFLFSSEDPKNPTDKTDPRKDSLQVWLERLDTPDTIPAGTTYRLDYSVSAEPIPEPMTLITWSIVCGLGIVVSWWRGKSKPASATCER
jgi:hypothetical protein